ncbi:hypothetical protein L208DRAFT_54105 [Tricholoma matsutake]|nr:hypothetical protein L208DRAFT_54105 [Tricholoma matsutake 945]
MRNPGCPEMLGCNTNPLTFVVIIWVVVICPLAGYSSHLFICSSCDIFFFFFQNHSSESRFDVAFHDDNDFNRVPGLQSSIAVSLGRI